MLMLTQTLILVILKKGLVIKHQEEKEKVISLVSEEQSE
jgi:hypothetical protein